MINPLRSDLYVEEAEIKCFIQSNRVRKLIQVKTIHSLNLACVFRKQEIDCGNFRPQLSNTFRTFARSPCFEYLMTSYVTSFFRSRPIVTRRYLSVFRKCWVAWLTKIVAFRWTSLEIGRVNCFFFYFYFCWGNLIYFHFVNYSFPICTLQRFGSSYRLNLQIWPRKLQQASSATAAVASMYYRI